MNKPKIGISLRSLSRDASDFEDRVSEVALYKPDNIELMTFNQDLIGNGKIIDDRVDVILNTLNKYNFNKTMHGPLTVNFLDRKDNIPIYEKTVLSYINLCKALDVKGIVIHTGFCEEENSSAIKSKYKIQRDCLKRLGDIAGLEDIIIYLENIFPFYNGTHTALPSLLFDEIEKIDHPFIEGCFDLSHGYIACTYYEVNFIDHSKDFGKISNHWHVHDSYGKPNTSLKPFTDSEALAFGMGDLHLSVGDADLPWTEVINQILPGSEKTFNIELNPGLWSDLPRCVLATQKLVKKAAQILAI